MSLPTLKRLASTPLALTTTLTTNIYNPASGVVGFVRHLHVANKTGSAATFSLWIGATGANAAGTEWFLAVSVPANSVFDHYCSLKLNSSDFLVGGSGTATALTILLEGEEFLTQA
jgi:hypothetical protein